MGFFSNVLSAGIKIALTPVAIASDVVDVVKGEEPTNTVNNLESAVNDADNALDDLLG